MLINKLRMKLRADLESPAEQRRLGTGWLSGVAALLSAIAGLTFVICIRHPYWLTIPALRPYYDHPGFRLGLHFLLVGSFVLACISLVLRSNRVLGFTSIALVLVATVLGGSSAQTQGELTSGA